MTDESDVLDYSDAQNCVVCNIGLTQAPVRSKTFEGWHVRCLNCGNYEIEQVAYLDLIEDWRRSKEDYLPYLSHKIRLQQRADYVPLITPDYLQEFFEKKLEPPGAVEQLENLVIYLAENTLPGDSREVSFNKLQAIAGASSPRAFAWLLQSAVDGGWIQGVRRAGMGPMFSLQDSNLTMSGWEWYNDIGRHKRSNIAFMAMPYGNPELDRIVDNFFRPAVRDAGFTLRRHDDKPEAGIIDNHMRVEIRRSRLVISDITHDNHGAIWEAGFAEGLGLPVIYTCEESKLDDKHFDIHNCQMVSWSQSNSEAAANTLKATIRNSLPDEALLEDPAKN